MITLGLNLKWTLAHVHRAALRNMFGALGVAHATPKEDFDVFSLDDGANIGVDYVGQDEALSATQMPLGAWIELLVPDVDAAMATLAKLDILPFDYIDKENNYFHAPGGQVFRLASRA